MLTHFTSGVVAGVFASATHSFSKGERECILLLPGMGVECDAHSGITVQHRYEKNKHPDRLNVRQIHLVQAELIDELNERGFSVRAGDLGENISTRGVELLALPYGALLRLGETAAVRITGLRAPCSQIDKFRKGLRRIVTVRTHGGVRALKAGVMGVVVEGGRVSRHDPISVSVPEECIELKLV